MQQLNYTRYVVQGGDFGSVILRFIAASYPDNVISALSNLYIVPPNATDRERYELGQTTAEENKSIEDYDFYLNKFQGYRIIQSNRPKALAIGMADSPLGNAMWIYDLMQEAVDFHVWTPEEIITWTMMYQIQGPYGGFRWYLEAANEVSKNKQITQMKITELSSFPLPLCFCFSCSYCCCLSFLIYIIGRMGESYLGYQHFRLHSPTYCHKRISKGYLVDGMLCSLHFNPATYCPYINDNLR